MFQKVATWVVIAVALAGGPTFSQTTSGAGGDAAQHARLAQQYLAQKRPDLAIPELQKTIELNPGDIDARGNLGVLLFFEGKFKDAIPQLRAAVGAKPDLWKVQGLLGLAELHAQETSAARVDLEAAFPHLTDQAFKVEAGRSLVDLEAGSGDLDRAASVTGVLLGMRPTDTSLLMLSYRLHADLAARAMLTLALSDPNSAEMHLVMARELARHDETDPAIANYREALKLNPQLPGAHVELGDLLSRSPNEALQAEAEGQFQAALALHPNDEKAELFLGMIAAKRADLGTAFNDDSRALALDPNDADACTELAKVLVSMNQPGKARELFERAIKIDPTDALAHFRLANLYRREGKVEEAKQQTAEYLKYKGMRDKLRKIFEEMRVSGATGPTEDQEAVKSAK